jgi:hypothetical protein
MRQCSLVEAHKPAFALIEGEATNIAAGTRALRPHSSPAPTAALQESGAVRWSCPGRPCSGNMISCVCAGGAGEEQSPHRKRSKQEQVVPHACHSICTTPCSCCHPVVHWSRLATALHMKQLSDLHMLVCGGAGKSECAGAGHEPRRRAAATTGASSAMPVLCRGFAAAHGLHRDVTLESCVQSRHAGATGCGAGTSAGGSQ